MYGAVTRDTLVGAMRSARSPVCWQVEEVLPSGTLKCLAELGAAFLFDWQRFSGDFSRMVNWLAHEYPFALLFLEARMPLDGAVRTAFLRALHQASGCVVTAPSQTFVRKCAATERFVFAYLDPDRPLPEFVREAEQLLGKSRFNRRGMQHVGVALPWQSMSAPAFDALPKDVPLLSLCGPDDACTHLHALETMVINRPGTHYICLPAPSVRHARWRATYATAARQLKDILQRAFAESLRGDG